VRAVAGILSASGGGGESDGRDTAGPGGVGREGGGDGAAGGGGDSRMGGSNGNRDARPSAGVGGGGDGDDEGGGGGGGGYRCGAPGLHWGCAYEEEKEEEEEKKGEEKGKLEVGGGDGEREERMASRQREYEEGKREREEWELKLKWEREERARERARENEQERERENERERERELENKKEKEREKERQFERARIKELEGLVKARGGEGGGGGGRAGGGGGQQYSTRYSTREQLLRENAQEAEAAAEVAEKTLVSTRAALRLRGLANVLALKAETRRLRGHRALLVQQAHKAEASTTTLKGRRRAGASGGGGEEGALHPICDSGNSRTEERVRDGGREGGREIVRNVAEASESARGVVSVMLDISAISTADSLTAPAKRDHSADSSDSSSDGWGGGGGGRGRGGAAGDGRVPVLKNEIKELRLQLFKIKREAQQSEMQLRERLEREFAQQLAVNVAQDVEAALQQMHGQNSADVLHNDYLRDEYLRSSAEAVECQRKLSSAKLAARSLLNDLTVCTMEAYLLNALYLGAPVANTRDTNIAMGMLKWGASVEIPECNIPPAPLPSSPSVRSRSPSSQTHKAVNKKWNEMASSAEE
jgi:hypothetical protein